jgi:hypothetical protein
MFKFQDNLSNILYCNFVKISHEKFTKSCYNANSNIKIIQASQNEAKKVFIIFLK